MVKKKDRLKAAQTIDYLTEFLGCAERLGKPLDDVKKIFDKIQKWKKSGGLEEGEKERDLDQ
jgi:cob(I)alamin adenosyltransferase